MTSHYKRIIVIGIGFLASILNILHVLIGFLKTPPGSVYMWTGHYYLDFFEYAGAISQGIAGRWTWINLYATDDPKVSFLGIGQYVLFGKLLGILRLDPIVGFWILVFVLAVLYMLLVFTAIKKLLPEKPFIVQLIAYLLFLFASSFFKIQSGEIIPFAFWNDKSSFFDRVGVLPHHLFANIEILLMMLLIYNTFQKIGARSFLSIFIRSLTGAFLVILLLFFFPSYAILLALTVGTTCLSELLSSWFAKNRKEVLSTLIFSLLFISMVLPAAFLLKKYAGEYYSVVSQFETLWQVRVTFKDFFLVHGPVLLIALLGIMNYFRKMSPTRFFLVTFVFLSYLFFFSPISGVLGTTNTRFLTPLSYLLFGVLAVLGFKKTRWGVILGILILILALPPNLAYFKSILHDKNLFSPITYLPKGIIEGFKFLGDIKQEGNVLTTPSQFLGSVVPVYTQRRVYIARHNTTKGYQEKNLISGNFFLGAMDVKEANAFLKKEQIGFVVLTSIEGYDPKVLFRYPFLKEIYKNKDIVIFKVGKLESWKVED